MEEPPKSFGVSLTWGLGGGNHWNKWHDYDTPYVHFDNLQQTFTLVGRWLNFNKRALPNRRTPQNWMRSFDLPLVLCWSLYRGWHPLSRQILKDPVLNIAPASWQFLWLSCCLTAKPELREKTKKNLATEGITPPVFTSFWLFLSVNCRV